VRDGPNSLSFQTAAALKAIYGANAHVKKGDWYLTLDMSAGAPSVQMVIDQQQHALRRRAMSPAFSERALGDAEPLIKAKAAKLCAKLAEMLDGGEDNTWSGRSVDLARLMAYYGYDLISDLAFGRSFELLDHERHRFVPGVLKSASVFLYYVGYLPFAPLVRPLLGTAVQDLFPGQAAKDSLRYTRLANSRLAERIERERTRTGEEREEGEEEEEEERKDIFHHLLRSKDPVTGKPAFSTEELQADTSLLIAAGSDGVALAICALVFYGLQEPEVLGRLSAEIRGAFASPDDIRTPKLHQLPYLDACIDESLRLAPPKPGSLPRVVLPGGTTIDGRFVPGGTTVGVSHYVIHRDGDVFERPHEFVPDRWLVASEEEGEDRERRARQRASFCPFGIGPMNCIGKNVAYLAIKLAVAHLFWRYDFRANGGRLVGGGGGAMEEGRRDEKEYQLWDWIIGFPNGPVVDVKARKI